MTSLVPLFGLAAVLMFCQSSDRNASSPPPAAPAGGPELFATSDHCMACHNRLVSPAGEDISIGVNWRGSMMANSARDPYWQAAVRREVIDHPTAREAIENECAGCHMPMARYEAKTAGRKAGVFAHLPIGKGAARPDLLAADGVSCSLCHQVTSQGLGEKQSFTAGFIVDSRLPSGERLVHGPFEIDKGRKAIMRSASGFQPERTIHLQSSEFCATCHTLYTHTLGAGGEVLGELPEQVPYLEWKHSAYRAESSCQACHMPPVPGEMHISSVMGQSRSGFSRHTFQGGNFFMPLMLNRFGDLLSVTALSQEMDHASRLSLEFLRKEAALIRIENPRISAGRLAADVVLESLTGHKLPTAYPSRRAWVRFVIRDREGITVFESGAFQDDGSIRGNDNDADPDRYEAHYIEITSVDQVQIYEAILADPGGRITTGLLTAIRYVKDNRLLPRGFEKAAAGQDIAPKGAARDDADFIGGGDRIRYAAAVSPDRGPFAVEAEFWYQPIAYRWARNLAQSKSAETDRFVGFYNAMSGTSAALLARDAATVR